MIRQTQRMFKQQQKPLLITAVNNYGVFFGGIGISFYLYSGNWFGLFHHDHLFPQVMRTVSNIVFILAGVGMISYRDFIKNLFQEIRKDYPQVFMNT